MLGWNIGIYRQTDDGKYPATLKSPEGSLLAEWQTGCGGLDWLDALEKAGNAICLGGNGYPLRYTATAEFLLPQLTGEPPGAHETWACDPDDIIMDGWKGKTVINRDAIADCDQDEWLLIEAWDES